MVSVYFYPDKPKAKQTVIMVWVFPFKIRASTGISINPATWIKQEPYVSTKQKRYEYVRNTLKVLDGNIFKEASKYEHAPEEFTISVLQKIINPNRQNTGPRKPDTILELFDDWFWKFLDKENKFNDVYPGWKEQYLKKKEQKKSRLKLDNSDKIEGYNTAKTYRQAANWLNKYKEGIKAKEITPDNIDNYFKFVRENSKITQSNTYIIHQVSIRTLLKHAGLEYDWLDIDEAEEVDSFDLYWPEVVKLRDTVYSDPLLAEAAHAFVINCQLSLRWSDLSTLGDNHFLKIHTLKHRDFNAITKEQVKTDYIAYVPIPPMAQKLIDQYGGIPIPRNSSGVISGATYRARLKAAAREAGLTRMVMDKKKLVPMHTAITPHNARHTAASRIFEVTKNDALKERLLGHKRKGDPYTKVSPALIADDLLDAWALIEKKPEAPNQ